MRACARSHRTCGRIAHVQQLEPLVSALNQADSLPFLFVGSGVSRRYLGHESWRELLEWAASLTSWPYPYFAGQAKGDLPATASLIADAFYDVWWTSNKFRPSRDAWADQCTDVCSPLKIEIARRLGASKAPTKKELRRELSLLGSCQVDGIITTNYDNLLEDVFDDYTVFVGQEDLLLRPSYQLAEIYKIHGSVNQPDTLVLCGSDYEAFDASSPYLVAKLMSVFVEHPIVFLGYSLSDRNVRVILTSLLRSLSPSKIELFRSRFIWVDFDSKIKAPIVGDHVVDLGEARLLPVVRVRTPSLAPVFEVLNGLERVLPVGILRRVQESIVEIVHSADPTRLIKVADLAGLENFSDLDVVLGVGVDQEPTAGGPKSYLGYNRHDLIVDTLTDGGGFIADEIVRTTLPAILRQAPNAWVPVHKYVQRARLPQSVLPDAVVSALARVPTGNYRVPVGTEDLPLAELVAVHGLAKALNLVCSMPVALINASELRQVLVDHVDVLKSGDANLGTAFGKATALFDIHQYGPDAEQAPEGRGERASSDADIRKWAANNGVQVSQRGPIPKRVREAFDSA